LFARLAARHEELRWHVYKKVAYFRRREPEEDVEYAWTKGKPRTVVQARFSTDEDRHFTGYRHDAAELTIRNLADQWAVQINPTYLFTWDGSKLSGHHDKALAGIKRFDRHRAVSASLRMWQHLFTERQTLLKPTPHEFFDLLPLIEVVVPFSINADDWAEMSDDEAEEAQGTIFDIGDDDGEGTPIGAEGDFVAQATRTGGNFVIAAVLWHFVIVPYLIVTAVIFAVPTFVLALVLSSQHVLAQAWPAVALVFAASFGLWIRYAIWKWLVRRFINPVDATLSGRRVGDPALKPNTPFREDPKQYLIEYNELSRQTATSTSADNTATDLRA
jgi:hypothetical protein